MKQYSNNRTHKGRVAYRTPSRWLAGRPEVFKRQPDSKLNRDSKKSFFNR
jgi:hypothetical protein